MGASIPVRIRICRKSDARPGIRGIRRFIGRGTVRRCAADSSCSFFVNCGAVGPLGWVVVWLDQAALEGHSHGVRSVVKPELHKDAADMRFYRRFTQDQVSGYLSIA